ncbi:glycosyltransferase family 2 protein [Photobacterium damselae]|uniref:glycosyltransferase family 2 protein n=1 Tax=Photobacterium damselae TaxID=38293 RepID=UPI001246111A|nr:glycosyltransferase family 2 protein [Photobacterium damselae]KAB1182954.1 glycosyltransferase family 2 protein [Photobacterium damselae subsp. damselae]MBF7101605.1 glycosyltransferase family 2 protein [Photobacterium damselae]
MKVSIIMPAYNSSLYIKSSIESVLSQTYKNFELIIINDCSSDDTLSIVSSFNDERIIILSNENNLGVSETRNKGLAISSGRFIAFLDSDDLWDSEKLELQVKELVKNKNAICSHSSFYRIDEKGNTIGEVKAECIVNARKQRYGNFIGNLTGVIDIVKLGYIPSQKSIKHEDYLMWYEVLNSNEDDFYSVGIMQPLAKYRVHHSLSSNKFKSMYWHWLVIRNEMKLNYIKSIYYFLGYVYNATKKRY